MWKDKKVLIFDVDDTVAESCQPISRDMFKALRAIQDIGVRLVFISGSTVDHIIEQLRSIIDLPWTPPVDFLGTSGTHYRIYIPIYQASTLVYNKYMSADNINYIFHHVKELVEKHNIQTLTTEEDQIQDRDSQVTLSCLGRNAPSDLKREFDPDGSKRFAWAEELDKKLNCELAVPRRYTIRIGGTTSIDITLAGVNKGTGITRWLEHNGVDADECLFFGDQLQEGGNDNAVKGIIDCVGVENPDDTIKELSEIHEARFSPIS